MIRKIYNSLHKNIYYSTSFHRFIAPATGNKKVAYPRFSFYGKKLLSNLLRLENAMILSDKPGVLLLQLGKIKAEITTLEELYILNEIFIDGCYNFSVPHNRVIVIDIGMNVGFASLFFAQSKAVSEIYSFEPFGPTYQQALRNFSLNEEGIRQKIHPANYGLAATGKEEEWDYDYLRKGDAGMRTDFTADESANNIKAKEKIKVTLKDAAEVLQPMFKNHPSQKFIVKIDCEGAEYEILEKFSAQDMISRIDVFMIEWHLRGPGSIVDLLLKNNFGIISHSPYNKVAGMIYAINKSNS